MKEIKILNRNENDREKNKRNNQGINDNNILSKSIIYKSKDNKFEDLNKNLLIKSEDTIIFNGKEF